MTTSFELLRADLASLGRRQRSRSQARPQRDVIFQLAQSQVEFPRRLRLLNVCSKQPDPVEQSGPGRGISPATDRSELPPMTTSFDLLRADLAAKRDQLSPRLRQIADYALRNPNDMALETIAVIAERAGVPRSSLIRFANAFGYDGFSAMQRVFRSQLVERTTDYAERIRGLRRQDVVAAARRRCWTAWRRRGSARSSICGARPRRSRSSGRWVCSPPPRPFTSSASAAPSRSRPISPTPIGQLGLRSHLLDGIGGMTLHQANLIGPRDVLVAVSFSPYAPETLEVMQVSHQRSHPDSGADRRPAQPTPAVGDGRVRDRGRRAAWVSRAVGHNVPGADTHRPAGAAGERWQGSARPPRAIRSGGGRPFGRRDKPRFLRWPSAHQSGQESRTKISFLSCGGTKKLFYRGCATAIAA